MDTPSTLIGIALFVLFMGPIFFALYKQGSKQQKIKKTLKELAQQNSMDLDEMEISNSLVLGLDKNHHKLLILNPANAMAHQLIDLSQISKSSIIQREVQLVENGKRKNKIIQVSVELKAKTDEKTISEILFYDEDSLENEDMQTSLFTASRWNTLISSSL